MGDLEINKKPMEVNENSSGLPNGLSNGTSEDKIHKDDRHKSKDRDRDKDKHRDKDRHKSSHKDKDRHSSSHKSSHKDKDKEKDRHRDKDRDSKHKDKDKERSDKDKERSKSKDDKHRDKERSDKDREKRDKDREKSDKHKDKERSRDKDRDRDHHRDRDKDKSSSSRKDRHHSSHKSSHKDKHKDREKDRTQVKQEKFEDSSGVVESKVEIKTGAKSESFNECAGENQEESSMQNEGVSIKEESEEDSQLVIKEEKPEPEEVKQEEEDEDDIPLANRKRIKIEAEENDDEYDKPLVSRKKIKTEQKKRKKYYEDDDEDDEDFKPAKKKVKKEKKAKPPKPPKVKEEKSKSNSSLPESPTKGKKKKEEEENVWRWWEEEKRDDGVKWTFLEHKGPVFADPYVPLPSHVKFYYNGEHMILSEGAEEVAGFYAKMLDHEYTTKKIFNDNFFRDWRKTMTAKEKEKITDITKCDFKRLHAHFVQQNELRKNRTKEEKKALKEKNEAIIAEYGWCTIDGHRQRIGNFKIEPPGLFRGRGEHPKQGMVKRRTMPEDVRINCSEKSKIPQAPPGHRWKEVRHDPTVTWLACWNENVQGNTKYVMLNAASKLKGEKDWQKYETARKLHKHVDKIRENYRADWRSVEMRIRQRGVALYFIDKLALRAGNEKDEDQADTVGCCSLRVEHLKLFDEKDGKQYVVVFDFLGKDSIRYYNEVPVEKRVFKNLQLFMENKQDGDDVFDRLNTQILNKYLNELLEGLTAKVFRTYNASRTLQEQLEKMTNPDDPIPAQILSYNRANREVAILCNHQRAVPKTFDKSMANLQKKIDDKKEVIRDNEKELKDLKRAAKQGGSVKEKVLYEKKKKAVEKLKEQLGKLEILATDKEENKQIALGTSKLNYLDPRITVAWCKKYNIPVDKVYNKTQRQKFQWAIDMATADYNFMNYDSKQKFSKNSSGDGEDEEEEEEEE